MKKILVISDGNAGHYKQSLAVSDALKSGFQTEFQVEEKIITVKLENYKKYILRLILNSKLRNFIKNPLKFAKFFYKDLELDFLPDIIISSGKNTSLLNALLALEKGKKNFFIGNPKKLNNKLFTAILTILDLGFDNQILLDISPTKISSSNLNEFIKKYNINEEEKHFSLLIGGDGAGYKYTKKDIQNLINIVNKTKVNWLVSTSRRTNIEFEEMMKQQMNAKVFIEYNKNPQKIMSDFLIISDAIFVTEDSGSMISEAIASKKPVFTIMPEKCGREKNYCKILDNFVSNFRLKRIQLNEEFDINLDDFIPIKISSKDEIIQKTKEFL